MTQRTAVSLSLDTRERISRTAKARDLTIDQLINVLLDESIDTTRERRRAALDSLAKKYPHGGGPDYLEKLREGWPE